MLNLNEFMKHNFFLYEWPGSVAHAHLEFKRKGKKTFAVKVN